MGSLFFMAMTMMNGAFAVLSSFGQERMIIEREQAYTNTHTQQTYTLFHFPHSSPPPSHTHAHMYMYTLYIAH
jgi:hypothetical protein